MLLRSCDSWTNTCLTAWGPKREVAAVEVRSSPLTLTLSSGSARVAGSARMGRGADGVGGPRRATGVASRSPAAFGPCRPRTRGAVRGHAVDHDADFKPFFAMI